MLDPRYHKSVQMRSEGRAHHPHTHCSFSVFPLEAVTEQLFEIFFFFGKNFEKNFLKETGCRGAQRVAFQNPDISLISFIYLPQNQNTTSVW